MGNNSPYVLQRVINPQSNFSKTDKNVYPYNCIGLLQIIHPQLKGFGTAFAIRPNILLTCAHNVAFDQLHQLKIYFYPASSNNIKVDKKILIQSIEYPSEYLKLPHHQRILLDVACLLLEEDLDLSQCLTLKQMPSNIQFQQLQGSICGYPALIPSDDLKLVQMQSKGKIHLNYFKNYLFHKISTTGGSSGSPIFANIHEVIGIHTIYDQKNKSNLGICFNQIIFQMIHNFTEKLLNLNAKKQLTQAINQKIIRSADPRKFQEKKRNSPYRNICKIIDEETSAISSEKKLLLIKKCNGDQQVFALIDYGIHIKFALFEKIKIINLSNNFLTSKSLFHFTTFEWTNLESLNLSENRLDSLEPWCPENIMHLTFLKLSKNLLCDLPDSLIQLKNLKSLLLGNNFLSKVPKVLFKMIDNSWQQLSLIENSSLRLQSDEINVKDVAELKRLIQVLRI